MSVIQIEAYLAKRALDTAALVLAKRIKEVEARTARERLDRYLDHKWRVNSKGGGSKESAASLVGIGDLVRAGQILDDQEILHDGSIRNRLKKND